MNVISGIVKRIAFFLLCNSVFLSVIFLYFSGLLSARGPRTHVIQSRVYSET